MADAKTVKAYFEAVGEVTDLLVTRGIEVQAVAKVTLGFVAVQGKNVIVGWQLTPAGEVLVISSKFKHSVSVDLLVWEIDLATVDLTEDVKG